MNTVKLFLAIVIATAYQSCASDPHKDLEPLMKNGNGIYYKGVFYPLNTPLINEKDIHIWITGTGIYIRLFNADAPRITNPKWLDINYFNLVYEAPHLVSSTMHINTISADEIDLNFEFMRPDGQFITGSYKGGYSDVNTE